MSSQSVILADAYGSNMSYLFFTSYARDNRANTADEQYLQTFVSDLENEIRQLGPPPTNQVAFFDTDSIETGDLWPLAVADALRTSRLCVCLYSPSYFNSRWCGREFRVFCERRDAWMAVNRSARPQILFPVIWIPLRELPATVSDVQYTNDAYPKAYRESGLRQLMRLKRYQDDYNEFVLVLAHQIVDAALANPLDDLARLPSLAEIPNPFEPDRTPAGQSVPVTGGITNACFVFVVAPRNKIVGVRRSIEGYGQNDGWDWRPYHPEALESVGAIAQQVAGQLGLRFQEITCDAELPNKLREARKHRIPAILVADAWSLRLPLYAGVMTEYDDLNLTNCAVLMPWNEKDTETVVAHDELRKRVIDVCPQKALAPPASHIWEGIRSIEDLRSRTAATLEEVRMRLLQLMLTEAGTGDVRKVENSVLSSAAANEGISLNRQPQLQNTPGGPS